MNEAVFYIIAFLVGAGALLSVTVRDIFHGAIWLALTLISIAFLYFYLDAGFLGVIQILVYVGGIMALFVFAIMLTAKIGDRSISQVNRQFWPGLLIAATLFVVLGKVVMDGPWMRLQAGSPVTDLKTIGTSLVTSYVVPFEFISLLLLAALVGAVVIGKVKK
ncbi:MAG: NADH-quinone oxidoreductase subunit J [Candidatus Omnitrophica bacterium]|nr:NADH-quinone oxidoreductase subunit J [Candidatus Omnitrophota bacterium]